MRTTRDFDYVLAAWCVSAAGIVFSAIAILFSLMAWWGQ